MAPRCSMKSVQSLELSKSILEGDRGLPAEQFFRPRTIGQRVARLKAGRNVFYRSADQLRNAVDRCIAPRSDVDDLSLPHALSPRGQQVGTHDVIHVGEVAGLRAITGDGQR